MKTKQLVLGILCLIGNPFSSFSQFEKPLDSLETTYFNTLNEIFDGIDMTYVESGVLYERGFPFITFEPFIGELNEESKASRLAFGLAYAAITSMVVDSAKSLPDPAAYMTMIDGVNQHSSTIPLLGLHQKYHSIDSNAIANGLIAVSGNTISDIFPRASSPFIEHDLFLFAPAHHSVKSNVFNFRIDSSFFYTNTGKTIADISLDAGIDSTYTSVQFNQNIPVIYSTGGTKNIKIRITYTDATVYYSHFDIRVGAPAGRSVDGLSPDFTHYISEIPGVDGAGRGGGTLNVYLACGHTEIEKPFIWAEAYNPHVGKMDANLTREDIIDRMSTFDSKIDDKFLYDHLRENGYDIIIIDYDDGGDYLPRTGELIKETLRWVNERKAAAGSTAKNVILGQSMGGVATALALKEMEVLSLEDHEVEKFIIFDSPINGVNIPLCMQASLLQISFLPVNKIVWPLPLTYIQLPLYNFVPILKNVLEIYELPATQTMVRYMLDFESIGFGSWPTHLYDDFYSYFHDDLGGMPTECAVLNITNGSRKGLAGTHNFYPEELVMHADNKNLTVLSFLPFRDGAGDEEDTDVEEINTESASITGTLITWAIGGTATIDIKGWASGDHELSKIYEGYIKMKFIWGDTLAYHNWVYYNTDEHLPAVDCAPGGFFGLKDKGFIFDEDSLGDLAPVVFKLQTYCFTPTGSVLNYHGSGGTDWADVPFRNYEDNTGDISNNYTRGVNNYLSNSETRTWGTASTYQNTAHTWFTFEGANYLLYHLKGSDQLSGVTSISSGTYNFGESIVPDFAIDPYGTPKPYKTSSIVDHSISVDNTTISVNANFNIGLTPSPYAPDDLGNTLNDSHFNVNIGPLCEPMPAVEIIIENEAQFIIGDGINRSGSVHVQDGHSIIVRDGGVVRVKKGGLLKLMDGGKLIIQDGGTIILEEDAKLITNEGSTLFYHQGGEIALNGEDTELRLGGMLYLFEDAVFRPIHDGYSSGKISIQNTEGLIIAEDNSRIEFIGDNEDDPYVIFTEEGRIQSPANMALMRFSNCKVLFRNGDAPIISESPFSAVDVTFDVQSNLVDEKVHPKLFLYNHSLITSSTVQDVRLVVTNYAAPLFSGYFLNMVGNDFDYSYEFNEPQVVLNGGNLTMFNCYFTDFKDVCLELSPTTYSQIMNSSFTSETYEYAGMPILHTSNAELYVSNSSFDKVTTAIQSDFGKLRLKCNTFNNALYPCIIAKSGAELELGMNAGYNKFTNLSNYNIKLEDAQSVYVTNGYNYFNDVAEIPTIQGTLQIGGPYLTMILAKHNRWNGANTVPAASEFQVSSSITGNPILFMANLPGSANCGYYDPNVPIVDHAGGTGTYMPIISFTGESNSMRLDSAVIYAGSSTTLWDSTQSDLVAICRFYDVLMYQYTEQELADTSIRFYRDYAYEWMKHTVYHAISDSIIDLTSNQTSFATPIQNYVDVLNAMSNSDTIATAEYINRFYLELDKAHLLRVIGKTDMGLNILQNIDLCPLDSNEQVVLNKWRFAFEEELAKQNLGEEGFGSEDTLTDISGYRIPTATQINVSYFGSIINSPSSITYRSCTNGSLKPEEDETNRKSLFAIYPNPSNGIVNLKYQIPTDKRAELVVYSINGQVIYRTWLNEASNTATIDLSNVTSGLYLYTVLIDGAVEHAGRMSIAH